MDEKCGYKTPTPADSLEQQIIDPSFPKNEREWWASEEIARLRAENERLTAAGAAICQMKPVVEAAQEWSCERPVSDWADAALLKVLATFEGDRTEPCEGCDGECGEPCQPCTVAEMHAGIDRQTAALVEAGKLLQGTPLDAIYAEADRLGCRLPSGDSPEGYSITLSLKNLRTEG